MKKVELFIHRYIYWIALCMVFVSFVFLRFFSQEERAVFGFDQVTNSWVMREMILFQKFPLLGMVAKLNTGFYIGPAYYYLLVPFYWVYNLDPRAGMVFVGCVGIITFTALYILISRLFSRSVALISVCLYTFSFGALSFDRTPWPVVFIPFVSILVFYFLFRVLRGQSKFLLPLASSIGFGFHTHFTAVFFIIIVILCSFWIIKNKEGIKYTFLGIVVYLGWMLPNIYAELSNGFRYGTSLGGYIQTYYHGLHLQRVIQLTHDAFIEYANLFFDGFVGIYPSISSVSHVLDILCTVLFSVIFFFDRGRCKADRIIIVALTGLWFIVPWLVMSVYKGEISNYYFSITRPIVLFIMGYLLERFSRLHVFAFICCIGFCIFFAYIQINHFLQISISKLPQQRLNAQQAVAGGRKIEYADGQPEPYLYEYYLYLQDSRKK